MVSLTLSVSEMSKSKEGSLERLSSLKLYFNIITLRDWGIISSFIDKCTPLQTRTAVDYVLSMLERHNEC